MAWIRACGGGSPAVVPDGKTVTPVNDVTIWQKCAGIANPTYTTIADILADSVLLSTLMSSDNAIDYLVRSLSWTNSICASSDAMADIGGYNYCADTLLADSTWRTAILNSTYFASVLTTQIPTMTSNTSPSGVASSSGILSTGHEAYRAFDKNASTWWCGVSDTASQYVQYDFGKTVDIYKLYFNIVKGNTPGTVTQCNVRPQISSDGTNWETLFNDIKNLPVVEYYDLPTIKTCRYIRLFSQYAISGGGYSYCNYNEFNAFGRDAV